MGRRRRPAAETRAEIIKIASRLLVELGPAGVKLDDVARDLGVSRQAVLHHYGNREGLMRAVVAEAWFGLFEELGGLVSSAGEIGRDEFIEMVDDVARRRGHARLGAWLLLSGEGLPEDVFEGALARLPEALHNSGVDEQDARYALLLVGASLFGDAVFGVRLRQVFGLPDSEEDRADFRRWLADLLWRRRNRA